MPHTYTCAVCGETHKELPALGFISPMPYDRLDDADRTRFQAECDSDFCIIRYPEQTDRFIRAVLPVPIVGHDECLEYGVWVSLSEKSFDDYRAHFRNNPPETVYFGMISNNLPPYETDTFGLHCNVITQADGLRPLLQPHEAPHPLVRDVYQGISYTEAERRVHAAFGEDIA